MVHVTEAAAMEIARYFEFRAASLIRIFLSYLVNKAMDLEHPIRLNAE